MQQARAHREADTTSIVSQVIHKAWLAEIRRQLGHPLNAPKADPANRQIDLFNPR
ncbi:hypothetical protein [Pseudomonas caricapapayae]|uniref:hypothetical protein n=1 Tax=Pseudomonas caricapapayae TaxID=46678 RepID=UPI000B00DA1F|nr:hypothetical protein [Pseudomonas caricapapayae]